jgi:hypothetical protein
MGGNDGQLSEMKSGTTRSGTMDELLDVLRLSDRRELYRRGIEQGDATGRPVEMLVSALAKLPGVTGLDALRASQRVVELLTGARWHMMRQAREEGASWTDVGQALGMSKQAAYDFYRRRTEQNKHAVPGSYNAAQRRAALDEKPEAAAADSDAQLRAGR